MPKLATKDREILLQSAYDALRHAYAPYYICAKS